MGSGSRVDGKKASNYYSKVTFMAFIGVSLVGVWMMTSSSVIPLPGLEVPSHETKPNLKQKVPDNFSRQSDGSSKDEINSDKLDGQILPENNASKLNLDEGESKIVREERVDEDGYKWELCHVTAGPDYIPCLDNLQAIRKLPSTEHYEHRERHCPHEAPTCLVPLPEGYRQPIKWPRSRGQVYLVS